MLKKLAEIVEDGLLQRVADKEIVDYRIQLDHASNKVDVIVLLKPHPIKSIKINWSISKGFLGNEVELE
jgi:hypothetical protein